MEITYLGHAAFRLRGKDVTIVTDPYPPTASLAMGKPAANLVTVSHPSPNHSYVAGVGNEPHVINGPGDYEVSDVLVAGVATAMQPGTGTVNTAYVLRFDDLVVCHLGDVRTKLTDKQVEELGSIDVLLVPVGGGGALGPGEAAAVVAQLDPSVVVPMHYQLDGSPVAGLEPVDAFCREMGSKEWTPEPKLSVTRSSLPPDVRVVVLENRRI
jgi:L-ascorbate metabolism protein UlaG (beta-lactamase superfamily)